MQLCTNYILIKTIISAFLYAFNKIIDILINTKKVKHLRNIYLYISIYIYIYKLKSNRMLLNITGYQTTRRQERAALLLHTSPFSPLTTRFMPHMRSSTVKLKF